MRRWAPLGLVLRLFLAERRGALLAGAGFAALTVLAGVALLGLSGWFITATALAGLTAAGALAFDVFQPSAGIRFLALARTAARYGERVVAHDATLGLLAALRERLFRGYTAPETARTLAARPARLLFRLTSDVDALDSVYLRLLLPGVAALATALAAGAGLALLDVRLGAGLAGALIIVGLGLPLWLARAAERAARRRAAALEALRARGVDLVGGQVALLLAGRLGAQAEAVMAAEARLAEAEDALHRMETAAGFGFGAASALLLAGAALAAAGLAGQDAISAPQAALVMLVALAALEPFAALRRGAIELGRSARAAARLSPALEAPPAVPAIAAPEPGLALSLRGVGFAHPGAPGPLFDGLDLSVARGERVAVIGASGAGKSTLLGLLTGEVAPQAGQVAALRSAVLSQRVDLFHDSVRGNLLLADPGADDARLWQALEAVQLAGHVRALPRGLDTPLGEGGEGLSSGQRRRLGLARMILRRAPLWLLDEPTEGLDAEHAGRVLSWVMDAGPGICILAITHLRREAMIADRLLQFDRGRLIADWRRGEGGFKIALETLRPD
ncbi:ATP-binding cassette domain-containing protein [Roseomonas eburnea]|uniref:ATP-binding cassette domain-containing protein n=1 Tax=Neoroseomonas eburnea TaxID=1346889 RepID=A0A9X9XD03_9PROT|nr:ATP-binding cassette domain-containing protein [Neoroseomonas eburnea]MBR0681589.1 ATP-binding cassette domain-containing protein [Neoroseomonas eburnea]